MNYPAGYTMAIHDEQQGRDDTPEAPPEDTYEAARDLLHALDRKWLTLDRPTSSYVTALRDAVAREREVRAADEARRVEAGRRIMRAAGIGAQS